MADAEVIVVGAGVAGLIAALRLAQRKHQVIVLEARSRAGGRIYSEKPPGWPAPVEVGAEFVHSGNAALAAALRAAAVKKLPVTERQWLARGGRREALPDGWERIDGVMRRIGPRYRGGFGPWLAAHEAELDPADAVLARAFVRGFQGAPPDRMSARALYEAAQEEEEQFRPSRRYDALVDDLMRRLRRAGGTIHFDTVVTEIRWRRGRVSVSAGGRSWGASAALVTVPLGVWKAKAGETGAIAFAPRLRAKERLLSRLESGHARRVVLRLRADAWRRGPLPAELRRNEGRSFGFLQSEEYFFPVWWAEAPRPVLVGWTGGPAAKEMTGWPDRKVFAAALRSLAKLCDCSLTALRRLVLDGRTHDWAGDPFTRGAYSFATAGEEQAPSQLARPVGGTLFFAGEATAELLELGTVHGALASGERAAQEILARLGSR